MLYNDLFIPSRSQFIHCSWVCDTYKHDARDCHYFSTLITSAVFAWIAFPPSMSFDGIDFDFGFDRIIHRFSEPCVQCISACSNLKNDPLNTNFLVFTYEWPGVGSSQLTIGYENHVHHQFFTNLRMICMSILIYTRWLTQPSSWKLQIPS